MSSVILYEGEIEGEGEGEVEGDKIAQRIYGNAMAMLWQCHNRLLENGEF